MNFTVIPYDLSIIHSSNITWIHSVASNSSQFILLDQRIMPIFLYVCPTLGMVGLFLNILVLVVLSDAQFKETLYRYLQIEAIFIGINLFVNCLRPIHYYKTNWLSVSRFSYIYLVYALHFLASVLEMAAILAQLCSTIDFYLLISSSHKKFKLFSVLAYHKTIGSLIILLSFLLYAYQIFDKKIACYTVAYQNTLRQVCRDERTRFSETTVKKAFEIGVFILRDLVLLMLLMSLNVLIFLRVKRSMKNKRSILNCRIKRGEQLAIKSNAQRKDTVKSIERTQQRTALMVLLNGLNYFMGRTPILVYFIWNNLDNWSDAMLYYLQAAVLAVYLSYTIKFFLYYKSNSKFRRSFRNKASNIYHKFL
jgi:hypothetical protein